MHFQQMLQYIASPTSDIVAASIDGSMDRRCFAIVTNERALLSKLGQPVRKVIQTPYCVFRRVNKRLKTAPFAQLYGALSIAATDTN